MRGRLLLGGTLLLGAAYFGVFGGDYSLLDLRRVRAERVLEEERLNRARIDLEALQARRDSLATDPAALERLARDNLGLIRDGERLYRFVDGDSIPLGPQTPLPADSGAGAP